MFYYKRNISHQGFKGNDYEKITFRKGLFLKKDYRIFEKV